MSLPLTLSMKVVLSKKEKKKKQKKDLMAFFGICFLPSYLPHLICCRFSDISVNAINVTGDYS